MTIMLECCVCGSWAGNCKQWHNRDNGYGICIRCAQESEQKLDPKEMKDLYGIKGTHYSWFPDAPPKLERLKREVAQIMDSMTAEELDDMEREILKEQEKRGLK
jgi:murein endopeptidase